MNLRPSGYEPDELPGCSTPRQGSDRSGEQMRCGGAGCISCGGPGARGAFFRFGGDLLSRVLGRSTIGAAALNGRVRDGIGCFARAMSTKPAKRTCWHAGRAAHEGARTSPTRRSFQCTELGSSDFRAREGEGGPFFFRIGSKPVGRLVPVS